MHSRDHPESMHLRGLERSDSGKRQLQAVPSISRKGTKGTVKNVACENRAIWETATLPPSPPFSLSTLDWQLERSRDATSLFVYRSPRSITYTTMLNVRLCDLWRCGGSIGDLASTSVAKFTNSSRALARAGTWTVSLRGHSARGTLTVTSGDGAGVSSHAD